VRKSKSNLKIVQLIAVFYAFRVFFYKVA